jgi:hypothetical protein
MSAVRYQKAGDRKAEATEEFPSGAYSVPPWNPNRVLRQFASAQNMPNRTAPTKTKAANTERGGQEEDSEEEQVDEIAHGACRSDYAVYPGLANLQA